MQSRPCIYLLSGGSCATTAELSSCDGDHGLQSLKYLLSRALQKKLADPWREHSPSQWREGGLVCLGRLFSSKATWLQARGKMRLQGLLGTGHPGLGPVGHLVFIPTAMRSHDCALTGTLSGRLGQVLKNHLSN